MSKRYWLTTFCELMYGLNGSAGKVALCGVLVQLGHDVIRTVPSTRVPPQLCQLFNEQYDLGGEAALVNLKAQAATLVIDLTNPTSTDLTCKC